MNYTEKITLFTEPMPGRLFRFQFLSESPIISSLNDKKPPSAGNRPILPAERGRLCAVQDAGLFN
ncbi:hypothetical protein BCV73_06925 [Paenibacillus sp. SSG-1]|nr:hypothetical protein BCV73_06925 [Paenibacillus sp. SSG-1]